MASRIHTRSISRGGSQDHSSTHSQSQSSTHSSNRSGTHSSSESQGQSSRSETTEPLRTTSISRGPNVQVENVSGSETTSTRYEDIGFKMNVSIPVKTGIFFTGT